MTKRQPNILVIMTDQQSSNMMSCAGNEWVKTPAMDSLAERGVRFARAYCTNPVCVPSRFSLLSGRYPSVIGLRNNVLEPRDAALPEEILRQGLGHVVRAAGYDVVYGGKEHIPGTNGNARTLGFDYICDDERDQLAEACVEYLEGGHDRPFFLVASFINPHDICHMALNEFAESGQDLHLKEICVVEGETVAAMARNPEGVDDDAFFANHCPPLPPNHMPQQNEPEAVRGLLASRPFRKRAREEWGERGWRRHRWAYARLTELVDRQIGRVLQALEENGLADDTVVIFTSDHGDHDGSHKLEHKTIFYEEATRVPLIVVDPDSMARGCVSSALACNGLDLFPTVCDYAGAELPAGLAGLSLRPIARGGAEPEAWRDHVLIENECGFGIETADYLYALYDDGDNREQLYDLVSDPGQTRNCAGDPDKQGVLQWHREVMTRRVPSADVP